MSLVGEFSDDASGATTSRPGLQAALRAARDERYDTLLVYRVDRFSRRLSDLLDLLTELDQAGVAFASATEPFDTSTSIGRMLVQLLGVFAEFERETIIDRVTAGMNAKAAKGKWPGGRLPYGYQRDPATSKLVPDPAQAPVVRDIFRLYTRDRLGTRAIAAELNARGLRTRPGKPWSGHVIGLMLANPAYAGDITRGDICVADAHEPLISRPEFRRAAQIAAARSGPHQQRAASPSDYHLTGLITCPDCGAGYVGTAAHGRSGRYRYYTCWTRVRYGTETCQAARIPAGQADTAVLAALCEFYGQQPTLIGAAITAAQARHASGHATRQAELDAVATQIRAKQAAVDRYHTAFENGTMDDTTAGPRLRGLHDQITQLTARRDELAATLASQPKAPGPALIGHLASYLSQVIDAGTPAERKAVVEALIHQIRVTPEDSSPCSESPSPEFRSPANPPQPAARPRFAQWTVR